MSQSITAQYLSQSSSPESNEVNYSRPRIERQNTSDILEYYNSAEAAQGYSAADLANSRASHRRPSTAPSTKSSENAGTHSPTKEQETGLKPSNFGSIRLVTPNQNKADSTRRPSLHHADSINVVMDNRRVAIVERDASPLPSSSSAATSPGSPGSPSGHETSPTSIMTRRGVDRSRLALVAPPDAAPVSYTIHSSPPSAASFALSKSSRSKYAEARGSPISPDSHSPNIQSNTESTSPSHARSSSENTIPIASYNPSGGFSSGDGLSNSSRSVGTGAIDRNLSKQSERYGYSDHGRQRSASSGSDYGDEPTGYKTSTVDHTRTPQSSKYPKPPVPYSKRPSATETAAAMNLPLPAGPRFFGASAGTTPILTPAIGDGKPIDLRVAAPVIVDIRSDLADLWLAATPDADHELGSSMGSPITAITTTTDSSSMPTSFSPTSSRQSSVTSPLRSSGRDPGSDFTSGAMQIPPRRIDVQTLSPSTAPVCPPRPQRQPSPTKGTNEHRSREGHERASSSTIGPDEYADHKFKPTLANDPDPKYSLANVSDDESSSDYSNNVHSSRKGRSHSPVNSSSLIKNGSIHIREGAFPPHSVFLQNVRTEVDATPTESDMKTPTAKHNLEGMFQQADARPSQGSLPKGGDISVPRTSFDTNEVDSLPSSYQSQSKMSHGRASNELPSRRSRPGTPESGVDEDDPAVLLRSSSLRPNVPSKDADDILRRYARSGKKVGGAETPSSSQHHDSANESSALHRQYTHTHLGHGPPPTDRVHHSKAPSAFKAKGPLVTPQPKRSIMRKKPTGKTPSMWPSAMSFSDVLSEQTALARARGYAMKLNELATEDCGLSDWIDSVINRNQPTVMTTNGPVAVGPDHRRFVSGSSAMSETTFPIRPDAYKAIDITPGAGEFASSEVPSTLPYQSLARQHNTGSRPLIPPIPPAKTSIGSVVSGSATFLATLGRKASMRTRGTQSATEGRDREPRPAPRKLVSTRSPAVRSNGTPPLPITPLSATPTLPATVTPTIPGGPRAQRPKRASTVIGGTRPIISAPIPIPVPPHSNSDPIPAEPITSDADRAEPSWTSKPLPMNLTKDVPRAPEGPRPPSKMSRTPSFPGPASTRTSSSGNIRSTMSFRPIASPLGMVSTGSTNVTRSDVGIGARRQERAMEPKEFDRQLDKLCDVLPHVSRDTLAIYLNRAEGLNMVAIGRYLEDERQGTILQS